MFLTRKEKEHYKKTNYKQHSYITPQDLKKDDEVDNEKQKERRVELQGEFKNLRPFMFDGEFEEAIESWLLNLLCGRRRLRVLVAYVVKS